ncbi:MAG: hypothetical protein JXM79_22910 [Sedimentisphaerales bacterium]|nr:hypothetical protein [Sedimentisphaerales bacterium]
MIGMDLNPCRTVAECLAGNRDVDEQTIAALAILEEKLERLKKLDSAFYAVAFSSDVEKLRSRKNAVAVG